MDPANPTSPPTSPTDPPASPIEASGAGTIPTTPTTSDSVTAIPDVNPAMPNAMGVSMEVPPPAGGSIGQPVGTDPNVVPNPFATPQTEFVPNPSSVNPMVSAPVGTAAVMPESSTPVVNPTPQPEVVTSGGGRKNAPWVMLGSLAAVVVLGVLGAFAYFSMVAVSPAQEAVIPSAAPVSESSPSAKPVPKELTLEEKISAETAAMTDLQNSMSDVDKGLGDKAGDLSE